MRLPVEAVVTARSLRIRPRPPEVHPMAGAATLTFTESNFDSEVLKSSVPVLVDFWAEWCGPCRALAPAIDALAAEFQGKAKVGKLNVDEAQGLAVKYGVQSIPTVIVFKGGQVARKIVGLQPKTALADAMTAAMG
ncbi:MAG: thioredoxin [Phycisphaerales bacterium]